MSSPYPSTTVSELRAISILESKVDFKYVKPDIKRIDKVPNIDGYLEITDLKGVPFGKMEVQVKTLRSKLTIPKYQCSIEFLNYCQESVLPVLIIGIDLPNEKVFWEYIDLETVMLAIERLRPNAKSVSIELKNELTKANIDYVSTWEGIISERRNRIKEYPNIVKSYFELESRWKELESKVGMSNGKSDPIFQPIHEFLDIYNGFLENQFKTIKIALFPGIWKIGIFVAKFEVDELFFLLYPISYNKNECQIKMPSTANQLNILSEEWRNKDYFRGTHFLSENLISTSPHYLALSYIKDDVLRTVEKYSFVLNERQLGIEYISRVCDAYLGKVGLQFEHEIDLLQLREKINERENYISLSILGKTEKEKLDMYLLDFYIQYLLNIGVNKIEFPFKSQVTGAGPIVGMIWDNWNDENIFHNFSKWIGYFPSLWDSFIKKYFPFFYKDFNFFRNSDCFVMVYYRKSDFSPPYIKAYGFKTSSENTNRIFVYSESDPVILELDKMLRQDGAESLILDGIEMQLNSINSIDVAIFFTVSPTYSYFRIKLTEAFRKYYDKKVHMGIKGLE